MEINNKPHYASGLSTSLWVGDGFRNTLPWALVNQDGNTLWILMMQLEMRCSPPALPASSTPQTPFPLGNDFRRKIIKESLKEKG
jgi:hypothetical protein